MRDHESVAAALTIAETGHLVLTTLHTNSAAQTIDRIIDSVPEGQQDQVRTQLSQSLEAIISQRILPSKEVGMIPAVEVLIGTTAVRNMIREGKAHQIDNVIETGTGTGMISLNSSLAALVKSGKVELNEAIKYTMYPDELKHLVDAGV